MKSGIYILSTILFVLAATSCGRKEIKLTDRQMEELIKKEIPIGSTKSQVASFVDGLVVNGLKAINYGYSEGKPTGTDELKGQQKKVRGYLVAGIRKVGRDPSQFQVYNMRMIFYFGDGERLIEYKIETRGDW